MHRKNVYTCLDCGCNTRYEFYMVRDSIWLKANPKWKGMLCIGCLEKRLGRRLHPRDFTDAPINYKPLIRTDRLISRLVGKSKKKFAIIVN